MAAKQVIGLCNANYETPAIQIKKTVVETYFDTNTPYFPSSVLVNPTFVWVKQHYTT